MYWAQRIAIVLVVVGASVVWGQQGGEAPAVSDETEKAKEPRKLSFLISKSPATSRSTDLPVYAKPMSERGERFADLSWLDFGIVHRTRFEIRDDFFRVGRQNDERFIMRSRFYVGIREIWDPIRFGIEFDDARRFGSELPENTRNADENELLQGFGELYFKDGVAEGHPLSIRLGRMSFDSVDRRLFSRNRFRNTSNAFDGLRMRLGNADTVWEVDAFAFQPVERRLRRFNHGDDERWLYGLTGYFRGWSPHVVFEPYYFALDEDRKGEGVDREIHTVGLHVYGLIGETGLDYDVNVAFQFGDRTGGRHRAFAAHAQLGYSFGDEWNTRLAAMFNYATGDEDPTDRSDERFDPLFGAPFTLFAQSGLFDWENMISPSLYLSLKPTPRLRLEGFYRSFWLESDTDAFVRASLRDPMGESGDFVGQEVDLRLRYKICDWADLTIGYAHFFPENFVRNVTETTDDSDLFYVAMRVVF